MDEKNKVERSECQEDRRGCPFKIKLGIFVGKRSGYTLGPYYDFRHATLCRKFRHPKEKPSPAPTQVESVAFPPKGFGYTPGEFVGCLDRVMDREYAYRFFKIRKAWAVNKAYELGLRPGQSRKVRFEGESLIISVGPRWGVRISVFGL